MRHTNRRTARARTETPAEAGERAARADRATHRDLANLTTEPAPRERFDGSRRSETAEQAFTRNLEKVRANLDTLTAKLDTKSDEFHTEGARNWGHVGDLAHINELLERALGLNE